MREPTRERNRTATRTRRVARLGLLVLLVFATAVVPVLVSARPANEIPIADYEGTTARLSNPTADAWSDVPAVDVALSSAPSGLPDASDTSVSTVDVQAAHDGESIYLRLHWTDHTADENVTGPREFADAVAVQVPANTSQHPAIAMGSTRTPVNVWYWNADTGIEELLAGGPGSVTRFDSTAISANVVRTDDGWTMVYSRPLRADADGRTDVAMEHDLDVAFAVWNGSNMERSGRKAVSEWYHLPTGPQPSGPAYESLLWAVAGLAIVVVVAATILAIRRT
ncbi:MAG: ethylbenzene dehydrogenase-related protein [Haloarculaceae archaeon]